MTRPTGEDEMSNETKAPQPPAEAQPVAWRWAHLGDTHYTDDELRVEGMLEAGIQVTPLYAHPPPSAPVGVEGRDREADRQRFSDPAFNEWLNMGISDCGHTVWDAVGDTQAAWAGWEARTFTPFPEVDGLPINDAVPAPTQIQPGNLFLWNWAAMQQYGRACIAHILAQQPAPSAPVGVEGLAQGVAEWVIASLGDLTDDYANMSTRDVVLALLDNREHAPALAQQPAAVDESFVERFCGRWFQMTGRSLDRPTVRACLTEALAAQQGGAK